MASSSRLSLPFGFVEPSNENFGDLGRRIVDAAEKGLHEKRQRARMMLLPGVAFYVAFSFGVGIVLSMLGFELRGLSLACAASAAFLVMGLLGHFYQSDLDGSSLLGGMSSRHTAILIQSWIVRALTTAFFVLPYRVLRNIGHLFPRPPKVEPHMLTAAIQIAAALDTSLSTSQLRGIVPRDVSGAALEEAVLLLWWSGLVEPVRRNNQQVLLPTDRLRNWRLSGAMGEAKVVRFTELMTG
ncbi:MAG: hypothetical protein GY906_03400 [bacterium]|nr:hypothetical protein [bacterium]